MFMNYMIIAAVLVAVGCFVAWGQTPIVEETDYDVIMITPNKRNNVIVMYIEDEEA